MSYMDGKETRKTQIVAAVIFAIVLLIAMLWAYSNGYLPDFTSPTA